jgi:hypothetical protein
MHWVSSEAGIHTEPYCEAFPLESLAGLSSVYSRQAFQFWDIPLLLGVASLQAVADQSLLGLAVVRQLCEWSESVPY